MNKLALTLGTAMGLLIAGGSALAQDMGDKVDRRFYLSPMATYSLYDGDRGFGDDMGYQFAIGKVLGRGTNIEFHGSFAEPSAKNSGGTDGELTSYGVTFLLFQRRLEFPMYGILGVSKSDAQSPSSGDKATSDQFDIGLGYMLGLGNWPLVGKGPALRIEARYRLDKFDQSEADTYDGIFGVGNDRTYHDGVFALGLYLPLGTDPNAPVEVAAPLEPTSRIVIAATDTDGDQIPDDVDQCPGTPLGTMIDVTGCERDSDADGVPNSQDACKASPAGSVVGPNGCPPDADKDGVTDATDECPNTPAGLSVMADGCALKGDCRIPSAGQRMDVNGCAVGAVILKGVNFDNGKATLTTAAQSILDSVAGVLQTASGVRIEVGGHTDSVGSAVSNQSLSANRAKSVKTYLQGRGVDGSMLITRGYGETQPVAADTTADGREYNRRVELKILD